MKVRKQRIIQELAKISESNKSESDRIIKAAEWLLRYIDDEEISESWNKIRGNKDDG